MTDQMVDQYIEKAIKMGMMSPEDLDGMTWAEVVKFIKQLADQDEKQKESEKKFEVDRLETTLVYLKSLQTAMLDLVEFVTKQLEEVKKKI